MFIIALITSDRNFEVIHAKINFAVWINQRTEDTKIKKVNSNKQTNKKQNKTKHKTNKTKQTKAKTKTKTKQSKAKQNKTKTKTKIKIREDRKKGDEIKEEICK